MPCIFSLAFLNRVSLWHVSEGRILGLIIGFHILFLSSYIVFLWLMNICSLQLCVGNFEILASFLLVFLLGLLLGALTGWILSTLFWCGLYSFLLFAKLVQLHFCCLLCWLFGTQVPYILLWSRIICESIVCHLHFLISFGVLHCKSIVWHLHFLIGFGVLHYWARCLLFHNGKLTSGFHSPLTRLSNCLCSSLMIYYCFLMVSLSLMSHVVSGWKAAGICDVDCSRCCD